MISEECFVRNITNWSDDVLSQHVKTWTNSSSSSSELRQDVAKLNVFGTMIPKQYGGEGYGFTTLIKILEHLAAADFGFAMSLVNSHNVALRLSISASSRVRRMYIPKILAGEFSACTALTEPTAGSDFSAIKTTARRSEDGWVLNGEKVWIVNAEFADLAIVFAQCGDIGDASRIGAFLVNLKDANVTQTPQETYFSQTSIGTGRFHIRGAILPDDHLILAPGEGFKSILKEINAARTYVAAMCNSMLARALSEVEAYGRERVLFSKKLSELSIWKNDVMLAHDALKQSAAQTQKAIDVVEHAGDAKILAATAKVCAVDTLQEHLPKLLQNMGAAGLSPEYCFSRHIAASQFAGFTDGASNLLRESLQLQKMSPN